MVTAIPHFFIDIFIYFNVFVCVLQASERQLAQRTIELTVRDRLMAEILDPTRKLRKVNSSNYYQNIIYFCKCMYNLILITIILFSTNGTLTFSIDHNHFININTLLDIKYLNLFILFRHPDLAYFPSKTYTSVIPSFIKT